MSQHPKRSLRLEALHVGALWSIAVAQPIFAVLGENPEFFVAHDARPLDLIAFIVLLCGATPLVAFALTWVASRVGPRVRAVTTWSVVAGPVALIALPIIRRTWQMDASMVFVSAVSVGAALAFVYLRVSALQLFVTFLSPAVVVVPAVFLLQPGVVGLLRGSDRGALPGLDFASTPPVVMVVFDQLPLPSLLDEDGQIDAEIYPHFASLARDGSWFPNATAVSDLTELALPSLLTGERPVLGLLPVVDDHPANLFTLLGSEYRLEVTEAITKLCPDALCDRDRDSVLAWFRSVLPDVTAVFLHIVLPNDLADRLPAVTQNWKDFVATDNARGWWVQKRDGDRRQSVTDFVEKIRVPASAEPPALYFLHVLLPHEPWVHLPSGQLYAASGEVFGLGRDGRWVDDEMAVVRNYQRHLLQVRFSDALLGQILGRLRQVGLYDDALVVVTSDHGASFRPEFPFRIPNRSSFADIASIPLFIKEPNQRAGRVFATNVETVDVVPTIAGVLGVQLPWAADGIDVLVPDVASRPEKSLVYAGGQGDVRGPADLQPEVAAVVARKFERFESPDGFTQPRFGMHDDLVGRQVQDFEVRPSGDVEAVVDVPAVFADVDPEGDFVPAHVTGAVLGLDDAEEQPVLALSLNGVVAGITRPYAFRVAGRSHSWEVIVDPGLIVSGANDVGVYVVRQKDDGDVALERVYWSSDGVETVNLILDQAGPLLGVTTTGLFGTEWVGQRPFRWTSDEATLRAPIDQGAPPVQLVVDVLMTGRMRKRLSVTVNDCMLIEEEIHGAWRRVIPLLGCQLGRDVMEVRFQSEVSRPSGADTRNLGVALGGVELR